MHKLRAGSRLLLDESSLDVAPSSEVRTTGKRNRFRKFEKTNFPSNLWQACLLLVLSSGYFQIF